MASDERVLAALPAFFCAVRGSELEGDKLKEFIEDNWLVALSLTFASTVCAPAMRKAQRHWQERTHWL